MRGLPTHQRALPCAWIVAAVVTASGAVTAAPLTLPELITLARRGDGRVKEAAAQLRILQGKYQEARWAWFPKIDTNFLVAGPTPEARNNGLGGPPTTAATLMYDLNFGTPGAMFRAEATGVLPIFTFGKFDALEELGRKGVDVGRALEMRAAEEAELQLSQAYWALQFARQGAVGLNETDDRLAQAQESLERLRQLESPQVTQMDVYRLEYFRQQVAARRSMATAGGATALEAIELLVGWDETSPIEVATVEMMELGGQLPPLAHCTERGMQARAEMRAIVAGVGAREQEVLLRERMFYPDLGLAGYARWMLTTNATRQLSPFAYDPYNDLSAGVALVARMSWDFPQKLAQLEQARGELEKILRQKEMLARAIELEIAKAYHETEDALSRATVYLAAEKNARRWSTAAFAAFDVGTGSTRELVDGYSALAVATAEKLRAWHDVRVGLCALRRTVGDEVHLESVALGGSVNARDAAASKKQEVPFLRNPSGRLR